MGGLKIGPSRRHQIQPAEGRPVCQLENKTLQQICYNEGSKKEPKLDPPAETF